VFKPYTLITYSTSNLGKSERVLFAQEMGGRRTGKYAYQGLLKECGGFKVGRGVAMAPLENLEKIKGYKTVGEKAPDLSRGDESPKSL